MSALEHPDPLGSPQSPAVAGWTGALTPLVALHRWNPTVAAPDDEDGALQPDPAAISYEVDAQGVLRSVSDGWDLFALANGAPGLRRRNVIGQNFWDAFADEATLREHRAIVDRCRLRNQMGTYLFRCDAPFERRLLRMQIHPLAGGSVRFESRTLASQPRSEHHYDQLMRMAPASDVARCSHCNRFRFGTQWLEAEHVAMVELEHDHQRERSRMIHTICPGCRASMRTVPELVKPPCDRAPA